MKVLYVKRSFSNRSGLRRLWREIRSRLYFYGQEGFFKASLFRAFSGIDEITTDKVFANPDFYNSQYDVVVINKKAINANDRSQIEEMLEQLARKFTIPKVMLDASANAANILPENILNEFDIVFKREHFKDLNRYDISDGNKTKLRTTMLPCLYVPLPRNWIGKLLKPIFIPQAPKKKSEDKKYDVFFSGYVNEKSLNRIDELRALVECEDIDLYGGLQTVKEDIDIPKDLQFPRMSSKEYAAAMQNSKIILGLDGIGQLTFRHLEAWYFGEFLLSSSSIRDIATPLSIQEGVHYAAFENPNDLLDVVRYYLKHEEKRNQIAAAGKQMFDNQYDVEKHGWYIQENIENLIS